MSNKFKNIEKIYFDDVEGKIGNSYIYNMSFSQGYSSAPSTLQINALSEDGDYSTIPSPNFQDVYTVKVGSKNIFRGFILSKEIQTNQQNKIANITLVDKSIRLDQYGIGLVNRHGQLPIGPKSISVTTKGVSALGEIVRTEGATFTRDLSDGVERFSNVFVIGREKFTSSPCDIPDVEYNQSHFDRALNLFSSEVGITFNSMPSIITARNYTGTIREVLNSLCSDSGQSFYYDSASDSIILFNLDGKFIDESIINSLKNDENIVITSFTESESLENTYGNYVSVREMRSGKEKGGEGTCATPIKNFESIPKVKWPHGVDEDTFTAACLAKISEGLRDHYCMINRYWEWIDWWDVHLLWGNNGIHSEYEKTGFDFNENGQVEESETWTQSHTSACFDENNGGNIFESKCTIDRVASYLNLDSSEVQQIFDSNPALYDGFDMYLVNVGDGSYKSTQREFEEDYLSVAEPYYKAVYTPKDLETLNIIENDTPGEGLTDTRGNSSSMCTIIDIQQNPQPEYFEVAGHAPGWYFKGGGNWTFSETDLGSILPQTKPSIIDVTADMVLTQYLGMKERSLRRGDLDGVDIRDANFDNTEIEDAEGFKRYLKKPTYSLTEINHSHIAFVPRTNLISNLQIETWRDTPTFKIETGSDGGSETEEDCVFWWQEDNRKFRKGNTGCFGSCNDQTLDEIYQDIDTCGKDLPPGPVCPMYRVGISFTIRDNSVALNHLNLFVSSPRKSSFGYRSSLNINYKSNYTSGRSMKIDTFQQGSNFAKLNINDVDATSSIFDPEAQGNHFVVPESAGTTYEDIKDAASSVYSSFTKGSSDNNLPRSISISLNGFPSNLDKALNLNSLNNYNITLGTEGVTMNLQYSDSPKRAPSMDYLQSRLHNQFHYTTINKFHK